MKLVMLEYFRRLRPFYTPLLILLLACTWPFGFLHRIMRCRVSTKRVLLVAQNKVAADHMRALDELIGEMECVERFVTTDWVPVRSVGREELQEYVSARFIHVIAAMFQHWDLVVFTNHPFGFGLWFSPWYRKLYVNHGLHIGKINNPLGEDGVYGRSRVIRPMGQPYYDVMFAASEAERLYAEKLTPELRGRVRVTGYLRADSFLAHAGEQRSATRRRFGYSDQETVVHVISTWGESSLVALCETGLRSKIGEILGNYRFVFSLHPRYDEFNSSGGATRDEILSEWEASGVLVDRGMDWECLVAAADIAISDHSSLSLYHVLLGHPLLLVDVPQGSYIEGSTFCDMKRLLPLLDPEDDLGAQLDRVKMAGGASGVDVIRGRILDCAGKATTRYYQELRNLLVM